MGLFKMRKIIEYRVSTGEITAAHIGPDDMSVTVNLPDVGLLVVAASTPHLGKLVAGGALIDVVDDEDAAHATPSH